MPCTDLILGGNSLSWFQGELGHSLKAEWNARYGQILTLLEKYASALEVLITAPTIPSLEIAKIECLEQLLRIGTLQEEAQSILDELEHVDIDFLAGIFEKSFAKLSQEQLVHRLGFILKSMNDWLYRTRCSTESNRDVVEDVSNVQHLIIKGEDLPENLKTSLFGKILEPHVHVLVFWEDCFLHDIATTQDAYLDFNRAQTMDDTKTSLDLVRMHMKMAHYSFNKYRKSLTEIKSNIDHVVESSSLDPRARHFNVGDLRAGIINGLQTYERFFETLEEAIGELDLVWEEFSKRCLEGAPLDE
jgi:hypothetical protein